MKRTCPHDPDVTGRYGNGECRICAVARSKRYNRAHPERHARLSREYYARNAEVQKAVKRGYREENPEIIRQRNREQYERNREIRLMRQREWRMANPVLRADQQDRRRLHMSGPSDSATVAYAVALRADPCSYCGASSTGVDHIVPLKHGGDHHWSNFTGACGRCNARKNAKSLLEFLR